MFNPQARGYHAVYRENQTNHCPGCGRTHWLIGRVTAECAFCSTAMPLDASMIRGYSRPLIIQRGPALAVAA
jgi:hypothetical protein